MSNLDCDSTAAPVAIYTVVRISPKLSAVGFMDEEYNNYCLFLGRDNNVEFYFINPK